MNAKFLTILFFVSCASLFAMDQEQKPNPTIFDQMRKFNSSTIANKTIRLYDEKNVHVYTNVSQNALLKDFAELESKNITTDAGDLDARVITNFIDKHANKPTKNQQIVTHSAAVAGTFAFCGLIWCWKSRK